MLRLLSMLAGLMTALFLLGVRSTDDFKAMVGSVQTALKTAIKPGDAEMSCAALEKDLISAMDTPATREYAAKALKEYAVLQQNGPMTARSAATIAASLAKANQKDALIAIMPGLVRSQRVMQLAVTKQCPWMAW